MLDFFSSFWDLLISMFLIFFWVGALIALFTVITDLFRDSTLKAWHKVVWFIVLLVVPFIGTLIYLIARGNGMDDRYADRARQLQAAQETYIRDAAASGPAGEIERAKALLDAGAITEQEYSSLKAKALA
ncbi:SHOCT domain-containing protein [Occultella kanbiaonis]|uniref:SHOCT domain-containing protein n=1 Tax=Occultella kanbiaonis TaxID=2675754 RepID=UPI0013D544B2|nr:SHOCT domain-containing protein [Occultella kanbiaonis]